MSALQILAAKPASRMGLKGPDAARLLQQAGFPVPDAPNRIRTGLAAASAVRVLRLGSTEFILEQDEGDAGLSALRDLAQGAGLRAWPVLRAECSLVIRGEDAFDRLSRICAFDFAQLAAQPDMAVMTLLADISVTFTLEAAACTGAASTHAAPATQALRLWADAGFATYLTQTLQSLSQDAPSPGVHP